MAGQSHDGRGRARGTRLMSRREARMSDDDEGQVLGWRVEPPCTDLLTLYTTIDAPGFLTELCIDACLYVLYTTIRHWTPNGAVQQSTSSEANTAQTPPNRTDGV